jgi:hypothetical protein
MRPGFAVCAGAMLLPPERLRLSRQPPYPESGPWHAHKRDGRKLLPLGVFGHECSIRCVPTIGRVLPRARVRHDRGPAWKQNDHVERKCYLHRLGARRARRGQQTSQEGSLCPSQNAGLAQAVPSLRYCPGSSKAFLVGHASGDEALTSPSPRTMLLRTSRFRSRAEPAEECQQFKGRVIGIKPSSPRPKEDCSAEHGRFTLSCAKFGRLGATSRTIS